MAEEFLGDPLPVEEENEEVIEGGIVRTKRFSLQPMSAQEAIDQIELLGHDFFVFHNCNCIAICRFGYTQGVGGVEDWH